MPAVAECVAECGPPAGPGRERPSLDPVGLLIASLPDHPGPPTAAEERAYAARIAAGGADGRAAFAELVTRNVRLVVAVATACRRSPRYRAVPLADLVSAGCEGLCRAVPAGHFDAGRGLRFSTYASFWIRRAIRRWRQADRLVAVPAYLQESVALGRPAGWLVTGPRPRRGLAGFRARYAAAARALAAAVEHDHPDYPPGERWVDDRADSDPAEVAGRADERAALLRWVAELRAESPRLARVVGLRYGLDGGGERTWEAIGAELGVTRERAGRLAAVALGKLREIAGAGSEED